MTDRTESSDTVTWSGLLTQTSETVGDRIIAKWMCEHASGLDGSEFLAQLDELVPARAGIHLETMVRRYLAGEPLQYVMGRWAFRQLDLMIDRRVLIPRPETEQLVDIVLEFLSACTDDLRVAVDLGTGSGAIGLSVIAESALGSVEVHLTDQSSDAIDVARANAAGLGRSATRVHIHEGSWFDALPPRLKGRCHVVASNPPYIADGDTEVERIVTEWEPHSALFAGVDGLDDVRTIISRVREWLVPGGLLVIEIGHSQGDAVMELMSIAGLVDGRIVRDLAGKPRFACAHAPR